MLPCKLHTKKVLEVLSKTATSYATGTGHFVLYLTGEAIAPRRYTDRDLSFKQESNFFYLTGCEIPSSRLVVTGNASDFKSTLFIPPLHPDEVM